MSKTNNDPYHHGNLREEMLSISLEILKEAGADAIKMREIAKRIGVSHSAAYRHFESKDALLAAIATEGFERLTAILQDIHEDESIAPDDRFRQSGIAYIAFAADNSAQYHLMYGNNALDRRPFPELRRAAKALSREVLRMVEQCQQQGTLRDGDTRQFAQVSWALTHGAAMLVIDGHIRPENVHQFADQMTSHLRNGIAKDT